MKQHVKFGYSSKNSSVYVPNGYVFSPYVDRIFKKDSLVLGAAGRFHDAKDYRTLFEAVAPILKANKDIKLKVAGRDINASNVEILMYIEEFNIWQLSS